MEREPDGGGLGVWEERAGSGGGLRDVGVERADCGRQLRL